MRPRSWPKHKYIEINTFRVPKYAELKPVEVELCYCGGKHLKIYKDRKRQQNLTTIYCIIGLQKHIQT